MSALLRFVAASCLLCVLVMAGLSCGKPEPALRLATTTSLKDSGLLDELLLAFEKNASYRAEVSAVGSGKALQMLREGAADVAVTHAPAEEQAAAASGAIGAHTPFMHNEFVLVGPRDQIGVVAGAGDIRDALRRIAGTGRKFVSRGDGSGTHQRETALWQSAGIAEGGAFLIRANAGMGATLERASAEGAFTLADRSTFVAKQKDLKLAIVFQGDEALRNTYVVVEPKPGASVNRQGAHALAEFVLSPEGRTVIGAFGVKTTGESLFTPERR